MSGPSQDLFPPPYAESKDILVNHSKSSWMRLYVPTTSLNGGVASKKLPLVVYFHSGSFISYTVDSAVFNAGCNLIASPTHRPVPKNKLPEAYDDGVDLLEWIKNNSEEDEWLKSYADLSNVFLMGTGTGGNVAYNVGLRFTEKDLTPLSIRGLILLSPFFGVDVTVGAGPDNLEKIKRSGWKVMVTGVRGGAMIDRQRDVAKLMKEKGVDVVERFTDVDDRDEFASIRSFIYSSAP
ncbi:unnamed protein product [Eruca vesicaria subsp. sativa]|uniref:Alpha/beta hydrolase fold-3 domain-containing protein n=1 Tax=Eruca vesicaria subsp. sativa TaxID=29727 RepID=A0ABC8KZV4_ERUVS|nr:unnamed protein product [Eruca vesicaria subsp. sativa]